MSARQKPTAVTKGTDTTKDPWELVGVVNPRGQETKYYFEWGPTDSYGTTTPLTSAGQGTSDIEVRAAPTGPSNGTNFRIVAFNDAGPSYGANSVVSGT